MSLSTNVKADESHFLQGLKEDNTANNGSTVHLY